MTNIIRLNGYKTFPNKICLGTYDSHGKEKIQLIIGAGWENLDIIATFNAPNGTPVQKRVDISGTFDVPPEATATKNGRGTIVFIGKKEGQNIITCNCYYDVLNHDNAEGTPPASPTPDLVQQILTAANDAEKTANSVREDADAGKFDGEPGPPGPKGDTAVAEILSNLDIQEILNMLD